MKYLVTINIPYAIGRDGTPYTDPLWAKDIERHAEHVSELVIAAPIAAGDPRPDWVPVPGQRCDGSRSRVTFVPVPQFRSLVAALRGRRRIRKALEPAIRAADVVQTNVAGWPLPLGWIAGPLARRLGKPNVLVVESAPWRTGAGIKRATRWLFERLAQREAQACDLAFFTHAGYRDQLLDGWRSGPKRAYVIHASWVEESFLIDQAKLAKRSEERTSRNTLRVLYAGRMTPDKGVTTLIEAAEKLRDGPPIEFTFIGQGPLEPLIEQLAKREPERFRLLSPVSHGPEFLEVLDANDCLVVPTISDEQPRVVYDAFSRGLPVVASDTAGNRECVQDKVTGWIFPRGNVEALAERLRSVAASRDALSTFAEECRAAAANSTHRSMHARRQQHVREVLASSKESDRAGTNSAGNSAGDREIAAVMNTSREAETTGPGPIHQEDTSLLLVLPVPTYVSREGHRYIESQAVNGLALWSENFSTVTAALVRYPEQRALSISGMGWQRVDEHPRLTRVRVVDLPYAYPIRSHFRLLYPTRALLQELITQTRYLSFAIGGFFGDWGSQAALVAAKQKRAFSVWTDRVESQVIRHESSRNRSLLRRLHGSVYSRYVNRFERAVISQAALGLFHGRDTYDAYSSLVPHAHEVDNIHLGHRIEFPSSRSTERLDGFWANILVQRLASRADPLLPNRLFLKY